MLTKLERRYLKERNNSASGYRKKHTKNLIPSAPSSRHTHLMSQIKGPKGLRDQTHVLVSGKNSSTVTTQGTQYSQNISEY